MIAITPITDANPTVADIESRAARFASLQPTADHLDAAIPGCKRTTWRVLGTSPDAPLSADSFHLSKA